MRWAALAIAAVFAAGILWIAGEMHHANCVDNGRVSCSQLPWDYGRTAPTGERVYCWTREEGFVFEDETTTRDCVALQP
jgi:hypothetical protein